MKYGYRYLSQNEYDGVVSVSATGVDRHGGGLVHHHHLIVLQGQQQQLVR